MIFYLKNNCKYLDYNTILKATGKSRSYLNRFLFNVEVRRTYYRNRLLFSYEDVLKSAEINRYFL